MLRLVRVAVELGLKADPEAVAAARVQASSSRGFRPSGCSSELRRIVASTHALRGLEMMGELGATAVVLPELEALRGVEQSRFHHRDVYGHTLEVLERAIVSLAPTAAAIARARISAQVRRAARRAAGRRDDARGGPALGGPASRRRQARHPRGAPGWTGA